jgi:beta-barrel assembly-enhancing protease
VQARHNDGLTTAAHTVEIALASDAIQFNHAGDDHTWPLAALEVEPVGQSVRLGLPGEAARLVIPADAWREIRAARPALERAHRRRSWAWIGGLTAVAAAAAGVIFIGVPLAAEPLARATPPRLETQIGENLEAQISLALPTCTGKAGQAALADFGQRLQQDRQAVFPLRIRAVDAPMVNAFALPGGAILVTGDLIAMAKTPDELAAVIAHEAAHVELRHVMQGVWRSFGFGVVLDAVVGGGTGAGQQAVLLFGSFTSLRYTRQAEADADAGGQALLHARGYSSQGMAPFFERLAGKGEGPEAKMVKELISSHPDTLRRAKLSRTRAQPGATAFSPADWTAIKAVCSASPRRRLLSRFRG